AFANWAWGIPMLIWLVGGGIILTIASGGVQFRRLGWILKNTILSKQMRETKEEGKISSYQAVLAALSGTIGTGNIIGVAIGIVRGGPGAIFWMWVVGFVAMAIKYSEVVCSIKYREKRLDGEYNAGPFMYIKKGFPIKSIGTVLAVIYALSLIINLLIAAGVHTGALVDNLQEFNINRWVSTIISMVLVFVVVLGGVQVLVKITDKLVPIMSVIYIIGGTAVILLNIRNLIPSIGLIFSHAFQPSAAVGGFAGASVSAAIRWGTARGMYSSDSGNGIQAIMHGQAEVDHPVAQGIWGVFEVFFDTIIICSFTAMALLTSGVWTGEVQDPATMSIRAFEGSLGFIGKLIIVVAVVLFAFSCVLSFVYFIESQVTSLTGNKKIGKAVQMLFIAIMLLGGLYGVEKIIILADAGNAISIFTNMTAMVLLSGMIRKETVDYFKDK
ncbi:MAG: sodium:alanine symporter family protein, partial [Tissierellia bacterium]|nr:sodium:alanine symporter family protein [Tissierellia bacterium]